MIKNKIELDFKGTKIKFHFGLGFIGRLIKKTNKNIPEIFQEMRKNPFGIVPIMMDVSAGYEAYRNDKEYKYSEIAFIDLIDGLGGIDAEVAVLFVRAFVDSVTKDVPKDVEKGNKPTKKKLS